MLRSRVYIVPYILSGGPIVPLTITAVMDKSINTPRTLIIKGDATIHNLYFQQTTNSSLIHFFPTQNIRNIWSRISPYEISELLQ